MRSTRWRAASSRGSSSSCDRRMPPGSRSRSATMAPECRKSCARACSSPMPRARPTGPGSVWRSPSASWSNTGVRSSIGTARAPGRSFASFCRSAGLPPIGPRLDYIGTRPSPFHELPLVAGPPAKVPSGAGDEPLPSGKPMTRLTPRQVLTMLVLTAVAFVAAVSVGLDQRMVIFAFVVWFASAIGLLFVAAEGGGGEAALERLRSEIERAADGKRPEPPGDATPTVTRVYSALVSLQERLSSHAAHDGKALDEAFQAAAQAIRQLGEVVTTQVTASEETARYLKEMNASHREIATNVEMLAGSAEESSSSVLEMNATTDEVGENIGQLASSVRETVASIEEMAYSIKEVAKNVDALSLTAEETSSRMNEVDVSSHRGQAQPHGAAGRSE